MRWSTFFILFLIGIKPQLLPAQSAAISSHQTTNEIFEFIKNGQLAEDLQFKFQDSRGFIWGSDENFSPMRFDGDRIEVFFHDPQDTSTVSDGSLWGDRSKYFEDSMGRIWIIYSTGENLDCYDPKTEKFQRFRSRLRSASGKDVTGFIRDVFEDSQQNIWIGSGLGVFNYLPQQDSLRCFPLPGNVTVIFEDWNKNIWLSYYKDYGKHTLGRVNLEVGYIEEWIDYPIKMDVFPQSIHSHFKCHGDSTIMLLIEKIFQFNPEKRTVSNLHNKIFNEAENITAWWGMKESLLMGVESGRLFEYFPKHQILNETVNFNNKRKGKNSNYPFNLFQSKEGVTWCKIVVDDIETPTVKFYPSLLSIQKKPFQIV